MPPSPDIRPRIVIVGAGFGGLACARALGGQPVEVTIVDRRNYHLFVPLLYQVATAALSPADIARPIRRILGRFDNIEVVLGTATGIDTTARRVRLAGGRELPYDTLVVATGSDYSYFGHPEWAEFAPGPRTLEDARRIRARLLTAFERAETSRDSWIQDTLMTTVIVGGGPTGVELAGASGLRGLLGRILPGPTAPGVGADLASRRMALDLHVCVAWPRPLVTVTEDVRRHVRARVEELSGYDVTDVDITVDALPVPTAPDDRERDAPASRSIAGSNGAPAMRASVSV